MKVKLPSMTFRVLTIDFVYWIFCVYILEQCGKTLGSRTQGTKIAPEKHQNRVLESNPADLDNYEDQPFGKIKLHIEEVQGQELSCGLPRRDARM